MPMDLKIHRGVEPEVNVNSLNLKDHLINSDLKEVRRGKPICYDSKSEKACAKLLELCVPGWAPVPGKTFQILVDDVHRVDFRVNGAFVEYHPIVLAWAFQNKKAHGHFAVALDKVKPHESNRIEKALKLEFATRYYNQRRQILDKHFKGSELILATSPKEFIEKVVLRFGESKLRTRMLEDLFETERFR
jgi:hypothetical protein